MSEDDKKIVVGYAKEYLSTEDIKSSYNSFSRRPCAIRGSDYSKCSRYSPTTMYGKYEVRTCVWVCIACAFGMKWRV